MLLVLRHISSVESITNRGANCVGNCHIYQRYRKIKESTKNSFRRNLCYLCYVTLAALSRSRTEGQTAWETAIFISGIGRLKFLVTLN